MAPLRLLFALSVLATAALVVRSSSAQAEAGADALPPAEAEAREQARKHFRTGIKLYQDANYAGALAEFEAAYRIRPGAGSLQNVALCQKALFRYAEAGETLEQLLAKHDGELNEGEQKAVRDAVEELKGLVGTVVLKVNVAEARVTLNGRTLAPNERETPIRLNVGEHALTADAAGYGPIKQTIRVASGQRDVPIEVTLRPTAGFLSVVSTDPDGYIGVDGLAKGKQRWRGPVEPGREHLVQIYKNGFEAFEKTVSVDLGRTLEVSGAPGPATDADDATIELTASGVPKPKPDQRGFYGLLSLTALGLGKTPLELDPAQPKRDGTTLAAFGVRGGYRLTPVLAAELMMDFGGLEVTECDEELSGVNGCAGAQAVSRTYALGAFHIGPNVRVMFGGTRIRFVGTLGAGIVYHTLAIDTAEMANAETARGVDPYFLIDAGIGFNFGPWLAEASLMARVDGATSLKGDFNEPANAKANDNLGTTLPMAGISLRLGWGQWRPR